MLVININLWVLNCLLASMSISENGDKDFKNLPPKRG